MTTASIVCEKPGLSRIFRCLVLSSRSLRETGYSGCLMGLRSRDLGLLMGPVHSVITEGMINGGSTSLAYSLTLFMLGAIFGVTLRTSRAGDIRPSILLGSRHSLRGLFGGGGPGLSEKLRTHRDADKLGVRCSKTGWLPSLLGDGCLISTFCPGCGNLTGNSSCGNARRGTNDPEGALWLIR